MRVAALAAILLLAATAAEAAPNCKKGKPCGNACIAQDKVCRIGAPAPPVAPQPIRPTELPASRGVVPCGYQGRIWEADADLCRRIGGQVLR